MTPTVRNFPEVFDSSIIATLKTCPQLFKKVYLDEWKSKQPSIHLHAGGAFAHGIEQTLRSFYENNLSAEDSLYVGVAALLQFYGTAEYEDDSAKDSLRTAGALVYYFDQFPLNHETAFPILLPGKRLGIEYSFAHPLPIDHPITGQPLIYCGRMDSIRSFSGGNWAFDEKTTSHLGPNWSTQWDLRAQFTGYVWGCRESGIPVSGVVVRGISILKTKYDHAEAICYRPDWQVERWYTELLEWITEAIGWWRTGRFKYNLDSACSLYGGCGFKGVCSSQDESGWLETYFEKRHWDPITRQETKL